MWNLRHVAKATVSLIVVAAGAGVDVGAGADVAMAATVSAMAHANKAATKPPARLKRLEVTQAPRQRPWLPRPQDLRPLKIKEVPKAQKGKKMAARQAARIAAHVAVDADAGAAVAVSASLAINPVKMDRVDHQHRLNPT
jgi:hypothetical protein